MPKHGYLLVLALTWLASPVAEAHESIGVEYTTADGVVIVGDYWTPIDMSKKAPAVILLHMFRSDRSAWLPLVPELEKAGFAVMTIDLRGHGQSIKPEDRHLAKRVSDRDPDLFQAMHHDVTGAYHWLQQRPEVDLSRLAIVGASVGCSVAIDYAGRDKSVDVIVLMTPGKNYLGLDSMAHLKKYGQRPVLMLASEEERSGGTDALAKLADDAQVKIYDQSGIHGTRMFGKVSGVAQFIAKYLAEHVGSPSNEVVYAGVNGTAYYLPDSARAKRLSLENRRVFSSPAEAQQRGLHPPKN
ncbi:MAG: alpha/beta fold hydrolase [Planctomycetes bacterium]|nr:alpha/beta fold hydrolase [Planctomycetota bacterium]